MSTPTAWLPLFAVTALLMQGCAEKKHVRGALPPRVQPDIVVRSPKTGSQHESGGIQLIADLTPESDHSHIWYVDVSLNTKEVFFAELSSDKGISTDLVNPRLTSPDN